MDDITNYGNTIVRLNDLIILYLQCSYKMNRDLCWLLSTFITFTPKCLDPLFDDIIQDKSRYI